MAYIGAEPVPGQNREVDDISSGFNGNATAFTLQVSSVNVSPESANNILINLGGVLQNPGTDYTVAASTLTFTTAPAAGLSFFGLILGAGINTATVADDTIGASKLIDTAVTAGSYTTADITVDAQGRITAAASGSISGAEIANNAVTTAKIADSTGSSDGVTTAKIATSAITTAKIADQAVTNAKVNNSAAIDVSKLSGVMPLAGGIFTGDVTFDGATAGKDIVFDRSENALEFADEAELRFGGGDDMKIYHDGTNSLQFFDSMVGGVRFRTNVTAGARSNIILGTGVDLYHSNVKKFETKSDGIQITDDNPVVHIQGTATSGDSALFLDANANHWVVRADNNTGSGTFSIKSGTPASSTHRLLINSSGQVGIGTSSPTRTISLNVADSGANYIHFTNTGTGTGDSNGTFFGIDASEGALIWNQENNYVRFGTNNTERMRIASDGHIGVGDSATSPAHDVHIRNNGFADLKVENIANGGEAAFSLAGKHSNGTVRLLMLKYDNSDRFRYGTQGSVVLGFETSDQTRLEIDGNGNIGAPNGTNIYNASDERLKKNVVTLDKGLTAINSLRPVSFNWIDGFCDSEKETLYGFIAQEVKTVDTNLISQFGADGVVEIGETKLEDTLRVNEKFITPVLVKAVQELSAKVTTLETEKTKLQTDLTALTARVAALESA